MEKLIKLNNLVRPKSNKKPKILGRGISSTHGSSCGRGFNGQKSRGGNKDNNPRTEGGQRVAYLRQVKRGFVRPVAKNVYAFTTAQVDSLAEKLAQEEISAMDLIKHNNIKANKQTKIKVILKGDCKFCKTVKVHQASEGVKKQIDVQII